jgi:hypothetical protein
MGRWEEIGKVIDAWNIASDWTGLTKIVVDNAREAARVAAEEQLLAVEANSPDLPLSVFEAVGPDASAMGIRTPPPSVAGLPVIGAPETPVVGRVGLVFNAVDQNAVAWAEARSSYLIVQISEELRSNIRDYIVRAVQGNTTAAGAAREIARIVPLHDRFARAVINRERTLLDSYIKGGMDATKAAFKAADMADKYAAQLVRLRAKTIARTEIQFATNHGKFIGYQTAMNDGFLTRDAGLLMKEWLTAEDERVCPACGPLDRVRVGFYELFPGGVNHPPLHPSCRCDFSIITPASPDYILPGSDQVDVPVEDGTDNTDLVDLMDSTGQ